MASYTVDVRNCLANLSNINAPQVLAGASGNVKTPFQSLGAVDGIAMRAVV
jgi:hypothetical protein